MLSSNYIRKFNKKIFQSSTKYRKKIHNDHPRKSTAVMKKSQKYLTKNLDNLCLSQAVWENNTNKPQTFNKIF